MTVSPEFELIRQKYHEVFGAEFSPEYSSYFLHHRGAVLGYRRAGERRLFVEQYLDEPVEVVAARALGRPVARNSVVELGNLASSDAMAMVALWGAAANDLEGGSDIAVATLTAPLRAMLQRLGLPIAVLGPARPERLPAANIDAWGTYFSFDPQVCAGVVGAGRVAIDAFLGRRQCRRALSA